MLRKLVRRLEKSCEYADALYSENTKKRFTKDKAETDFRADANAGVKFRAYDGQRFREACIQSTDAKRMEQAVETLARDLKERPVKGRTRRLKISRKTLKKKFSLDCEDPADVSIAEKAAAVDAIHKQVMEREFVNCQVVYREEEEQRVFVNRYRELSSRWTGCTLVVVPFVRTQEGETRSDFYANFSNGFDVVQLDDDFTAFLDRAVKVGQAAKIAPGTYTAVLHPTVSGLLAHESFGHGMEADTMRLGRAKAAEYLGKKIAGVKVNIVDDPSVEGTHGFLFFDDEGNLPSRTHLIERGVVTRPISDMLSATHGNWPLTGNGRAEAFDHKAYARMTNTFFLPGPDNVEKLIGKVEDGVYIHTGTSGMEDPKGWGVQIAGLIAERIRNGKLTGELYYEASIGGYLPDILRGIKGVGNDFEIVKDAGFCGKNHKEWVRVSSGGPHLLIEKLELS